jgi:hypothetical protein
MLEFTRSRATAAGISVSLHHAGFLTYRHPGTPAVEVFEELIAKHCVAMTD